MATAPASIARPMPRVRSRAGSAFAAIGLVVVMLAVTSLAVGLGRLPSSVAPRNGSAASLAVVRMPTMLDRLPGVEETAVPKSPYPIGGFAFVRCTNLWTAHADGSNPRRILSMPGISSPTFSPDGRTIAFLASTPSGTDIWLAAADGSSTRRLGTIASDGAPVLTNVGPLGWSPDGSRLSFSLTPAAPRGGTPTHWVLWLGSGSFEAVGSGGDEAVWFDRQVLVAGREDGRVERLWGRGWTAKRLSRRAGVQAVAFAPGWWAWEWERQTAMLVDDGAGALSLTWQRGASRTNSAVTAEAPPGYEFDPGSGLAILQHGTVAVTLLDEGERDLGLYDPVTNGWTTLDYAWDAAGSPAPAAFGSLEEQRAVQLARDLLYSLGRPDPSRAELLLDGPLDPGLVPFRQLGYAIGEADGAAGMWTIPAHTYGRAGTGVGTRDVDVIVRDVGGRLAASVEPAGPIVRLRSVEDAARYLDRILTVPVLAPAGLPEGTRLAARWAIDAWSWRGRTTGGLHVVAPGLGRLDFYYGSGGLGCGAYPVPLELATGTRAIVQDPEMSGGYNAIAWPAAPRDTSGPFGISANVPTQTLVAIANAMDADRRPLG